MKHILIIVCLFFLNHSILGQNDTIESLVLNQPEEITNATIKTKCVLIDLSNPDDVDFALKKIHTFKLLETVVLEGEADETMLKKLLIRLSVSKNLTNITFKNNELTKIPENISTIKTLKSFTVEGNSNLDYSALFVKIGNLQINELRLIDNDLKKCPLNLNEIKWLKKIEITGNNQLNYEELVEQLALVPALTNLSIPVNYITELPKNITKLRSLQVLDVSNNILSDLPDEVSSLKAINNLSIQGNLFLNPVKDLEKFKGNEILYLSLDKEMSGDEVEQIKKMFPKAEINFPVDEEEKEMEQEKVVENKAVVQKTNYSGELKAKRESVILSGAYLSYAALFQGLEYNFDTLNFEERYQDFRYTNVFQKISNRTWFAGSFHFRKSSVNYEKPGKKSETWFRMPLMDQSISLNYPELRAFSGMYWVYQGELSKKQFKKNFLIKRQQSAFILGSRGPFRSIGFNVKRKIPIKWDDVRIEFDKNNSMFTIHVKGANGFEKFNAYPVVPDAPSEKTQQTYNRRHVIYQKALLRRSQSFKRTQLREKRKYDANFKKMEEYAWKELQLRMSNDEKLMSKEDWLAYYDNIIANEKKAIDNSALSRVYIMRGLTLRGYNTSVLNINAIGAANDMGTAESYGLRTVSVNFIDAEGLGNLPAMNIYVLDKKSKAIFQYQGTFGLSPNLINLKQFASYSILIELRNGSYAVVNSEEIDKQVIQPNKTYRFKAKTLDKNLNTIGEVFKECGIE